MVNGTKFLRNTYQNIVRVNMLPVIEKMDYNDDFTVIYGEYDDMVNPNYVLENVNDKL